MVKAIGRCALCGANKLLNFAGLCKRCNKKQESVKFSRMGLAKQAMLQKQNKAAKKAEEEKADEAQAEEQAPQEEQQEAGEEAET